MVFKPLFASLVLSFLSRAYTLFLYSLLDVFAFDLNAFSFSLTLFFALLNSFICGLLFG